MGPNQDNLPPQSQSPQTPPPTASPIPPGNPSFIPKSPKTPNFTTPLFNLYPVININRPEKPNRFYAIPIIGFLIKIIILIPVAIWLCALGIGGFFVSIINSFIVLFTGKYWNTAYNYNLGLLRLFIKITYYMQGLTDKYPGFSRTIPDFSADLQYPEHPNKLFAIPIIGGVIRIILLIPYLIYQAVISNAANIGVFFSFFPVLFMGKYPESTFELARDSGRVSQATFVYMAGISDKYPSFHISMNHKVIKIILIIIGILLFLGSNANSLNPLSKTKSSKSQPTLQKNVVIPGVNIKR